MRASPPNIKLSFWALIALVVGSMLDAGIFSLPATFGRATGVVGVFLAWGIAGGGMLTLALVFQDLANRKWNLDAGIFAYAKDGFGDYLGFISALGFWAGGCVGMVSYFILVKSSLGKFFPVFGDGNTLTAILTASALLWTGHFFILRGIKQAASLHTVTTALKVILLCVFLFFVMRAFDINIFLDNSWILQNVLAENADLSKLNEYGFAGHAAALMEPTRGLSVFFQVRHIMLVTVYVFVGIEGASIYSRYAKNRLEVGKATIIGFLVVLFLYFLATTLPFGVLLRADLVALRQPSMVGVLQTVLGQAGVYIVNIGLVISIIGAYLAWVMISVEVLCIASRSHTMPAFLSVENAAGVPTTALWLTNGLIQIFLIITLWAEYAYGFALELTGALNLIPYFLVAIYAFKLTVQRNALYLSQQSRRKHRLIAGIAVVYISTMLVMGGPKYFLLPSLIYLPGTILFLIARHEQKLPFFAKNEKYIFGAICVLAIFTVILLEKGIISFYPYGL